jgi:hypothetical protein
MHKRGANIAPRFSFVSSRAVRAVRASVGIYFQYLIDGAVLELAFVLLSVVAFPALCLDARDKTSLGLVPWFRTRCFQPGEDRSLIRTLLLPGLPGSHMLYRLPLDTLNI